MTIKFTFYPKRFPEVVKPLWKKLTTGKQELLQTIGDILVEGAKERINSSKSDLQSRPWAPWAESTSAARRKEGSASLGLLKRTGNLENSIYSRVTTRTVAVGAKASYAGYLQDGTPNMPARTFLGFGILEIRKTDAAIKQFLGKE